MDPIEETEDLFDVLSEALEGIADAVNRRKRNLLREFVRGFMGRDIDVEALSNDCCVLPSNVVGTEIIDGTRSILDVRICSTRKEYKTSLEPINFDEVRSPHDTKPIQLAKSSHLLCTFDSSKDRPFISQMETRKKRSLSFGRKSTVGTLPDWVSKKEELEPITHLTSALKTVKNCPPGFDVVQMATAKQDASIDMAGSGVPLFLCTRKGSGPPISSLYILDRAPEVTQREDFYYIGKPMNLIDKDTPRILAYKVNMAPLLDRFLLFEEETLVASQYLFAILVGLYDYDDAVVNMSLKSMQGVVSRSFKLPKDPLNLFLRQLIELSISLDIQCSRFPQQINTLMLDILRQYTSIVSTEVYMHVLHMYSVMMVSPQSPVVGQFIDIVASQLKMNPTEKQEGTPIEQLYCSLRSSLGDLADSIEADKRTDSHFRKLFHDILPSPTSNFDQSYIEEVLRDICQEYGLTQDEMDGAKPKIHLFFVCILTLSRFVAQPRQATSIRCNSAPAALEEMQAEESIILEASDIAKSKKKRECVMQFKTMYPESGVEWNAFWMRKVNMLQILNQLLLRSASFCSTIKHIDTTGTSRTVVNAPAMVMTRKFVFPSLVFYLWWSVSEQHAASNNAFKAALVLLSDIIGSTHLAPLFRFDVGLIWSELLLPLLRNELNIVEVLRPSFQSWFMTLQDKTEDQFMDKELTKLALALKVDILEFFCEVLQNPQDIIDLYFFNDLNHDIDAAPLFEHTCTTIVEIPTLYKFRRFTMRTPQVATFGKQSIRDTRVLFVRPGEDFTLKPTRSDDSKEEDGDVDVYEQSAEMRFVTLRALVDEHLGHPRTPKEALSLVSLTLSLRLCTMMCNHVLLNETDASQYTNIGHLRYEADRIASQSGNTATAIQFLLHFGRDFDIATANMNKKRTLEIDDTITKEIALFLHRGLDSLLLSSIDVTNFILTGVADGVDIGFTDTNLYDLRHHLMQRIYENNIYKERNTCLYSCLVTIFQSPWLILPTNTDHLKQLLSAFAHVFHKSIFVSVNEDKCEKFEKATVRTGKEELVLLCATLCAPVSEYHHELYECDKGEEVRIFVDMINTVGRQTGLLNTQKEKGLPKHLLKHLSRMMKQDPFLFWRTGENHSASPSPANNKRFSLAMQQGSVESDTELRSFLPNARCNSTLRYLTERTNLRRAIAPLNFPSGRSHRLLLPMIEVSWMQFVSMYCNIFDQVCGSAWRRYESMELLYWCLDGLQYITKIAIQFEIESAMQGSIYEIARMRYFFKHFDDEDLREVIRSGTYIKEQMWIGDVLQLAKENKQQSKVKLGFIVESTRSLVEHTVNQQRIKELEGRFTDSITLLNGVRFPLKSMDILRIDLHQSSKAKPVQEVMYLFSDLVLTAEQEGMYLNRRLCLKLQAMDSVTPYEDEGAPPLVGDLEDMERLCVLLTAYHVKSVIIFVSSKERDFWLTEFNEFAETQRKEHSRLVRSLQVDPGSLDDKMKHASFCNICLRSFALFKNRKGFCVPCRNDVCSSCLIKVENEQLCQACAVYRTSK